MSVTRIHEDPRVTKPYTRRAVAGDRRARRARSTASSPQHDVRLTQGGEPTFVSIDDMEGAGVELHRALAEEARARRDPAAAARARASRPAASLHYGQGKWYPGEPLPRWALGVYLAHRRRSRCGAIRALHRRHARKPGKPTIATARARSASALARARSACRPSLVITAYEDVPQPARRRGGAAGRTSIRCRPISRSPTSARGSRACCGTGLERPGRLRAAAARACRSRRGQPSAGSRARGRCGASGCIALAGDSPLGCACRSPRCPTCCRRRRSTSPPVDPFAPRDALPQARRARAPARRTCAATSRAR